MERRMQQKTKKNAGRHILRRLAVANLVAALALLTVTAVVLRALGLLDSIFAFFF